jgi:hypothetical protein
VHHILTYHINDSEGEKYAKLRWMHDDEKVHLEYGIALLSGLFGRFDFDGARDQFARIASSNSFVSLLYQVLLSMKEKSTLLEDLANCYNVVSSLLTDETDGKISIIRIVNPELCTLNLPFPRIIKS